MNVRKMKKDELELLSFTDIAYNLIKTDKKPKTTVVIFKEICSLLGLSDKEYEEKIADFFTSLTVDKRFILLNSVDWDLKENHSIKTIIDDSEDEFEELDEEFDELDDSVTDEDEDNFEDEEDGLDDIDTEEIDELDELDELEDLEIVDEEVEETDE